MPSLTIRHITTYHYRQPVGFGEHRMMFRPRNCQDQQVTDAVIEIDPAPSCLHFVQDGYGNHIGIAQFSGAASKLSFTSIVRVEHSPLAQLDSERVAGGLPVTYSTEESAEVARYIEPQYAQDEIGDWALQFLPATGSLGALELLTRLSQGIHQGFRYQRREAKGIQPPAETLRLRQGSCRDFAVLMTEAARTFGFAARFASGYLAIPLENPEEPAIGSPRGSTHAWAQIHMPGTGWVDFDPTSGRVGKSSLVTVAVARDPRHAIPLHGTFIGHAADHLGMEVQVQVTAT